MPYAAVSSFSLFRALGPLQLERRDENGALQPMVMPFPSEHTLAEFGRLARERLGARAVEFCQIQFSDADRADIDGLRAAMDEAGVRVMTVPIDVGDLTTGSDAHRADDVARIERWFEIAHRLGADYARVNAGAPIGGSGDASTGVVDALRHLSDRARALGLTLLVENHGGLSSDPEFMLRLLDDVGRDRLGLILDLGNLEPLIGISHARLAGGRPDTAGADMSQVYESIKRLAPAATLVHAKMYDPANDGSPLFDLPRALGIVAASGYRGSVSVESEQLLGDPWENAATTLAAVRQAFPALQ